LIGWRERAAALRRLRGRGEVRLLAAVLAGAPLVPALMRLPLPVLGRLLCARPACPRRTLAPERVAAVVEVAQTVAHPVVRRGCMTRGVALFWLLRRSGGDLRLCFGLGGPEDGFAGHCWLEHGGEPFLERVDPRGRFPVQFAVPVLERGGILDR